MAAIAGVTVVAVVTVAAVMATDDASQEQVDAREDARERNAARAPGDIDGDGRTDLVVYRPASATFWIQQSTDGDLAVPLGQSGDVPTSGDFDGDGKTDLVVVRAGVAGSPNTWLIRSSDDGSERSMSFGLPGDVPQPGDYDGDGRDDIAVFRPSVPAPDAGAEADGTALWYIERSSDTVLAARPFGITGDIPAAGDYDGDGITDLAVQRGDTRWIQQSSDGATVARQFGQAGDAPVTIDRDGDRGIDLAVLRNEGEHQVWYFDKPGADTPSSFPFGRATAPFQQRFVGDFDGDGLTEPAVFDPSTAAFWIWTPSEVLVVPWGAEGDVVLPLGVDPNVGVVTPPDTAPPDTTPPSGP